MKTTKVRIDKLRQIMGEKNIEALLIIKPENRYYMSGFSGSNAFLVITQCSANLITDFRYIQQATAECPEYQIVKYNRTDLHEVINTILAEQEITSLAFDEKYVTYSMYKELKEKLAVSLISVHNIVEDIRVIKDNDEVDAMQKAQQICEQAFSDLLSIIKPGVLEVELANELEYKIKKLGASRISFPSIVASGQRSSLPHGRASNKIVEAGDFITFDFGAYYKGYCSDMTRTVAVAHASQKQKEIYNIVLDAQLSSLKACKPGVTGKYVDGIARDIITNAGYGNNFGHGLGHGVGKMVHEAPSVNARSETELKPGHVITIEPGIYIEGWGGVRIEDMVLITENGYHNFNKFTKELLIIEN